MKLRLPLYGRFLPWFFLNLALLVVCGVLLIRSQLKVDRIVTSLIGERAQPVAETLIADLRSRPISQWTEELARYSGIHGVQFLVVRNSGTRIAGTNVEIPAEVIRRLTQRNAGPRSENGPPPRGFPPPEMDGFEPPPDAPPFGGPRPPHRGPGTLIGFVHSSHPGRYWLVVDAALPDPEQRRPTSLLVFSETLSGGGFFFNFTPWIWAGSAVILLSSLWWFPFVGGITRAIAQMTSATERIAEGRFDGMVDEQRGDEIGRLGTAINQMAGRLEGFVVGQKRFLGDIAHELCSPLARMEMALGILDQRLDDARRDYVQDVREEVRHMSGLVNELLSFSKAGLRARDLPMDSVPLLDAVQRAIEREGVPVDRIQVAVATDLTVAGSADLLTRAVGNLVRNAIRYAGDAGPISVTATVLDGEVRLTIADNGPGVPEEALSKLGEPFYRPDAARTREDGGVGLGLAIVRSCIEACQGTVTFRNRKPVGFEAELLLKPSATIPTAASAET